jgi:hypothetical protein
MAKNASTIQASEADVTTFSKADLKFIAGFADRREGIPFRYTGSGEGALDPSGYKPLAGPMPVTLPSGKTIVFHSAMEYVLLARATWPLLGPNPAPSKRAPRPTKPRTAGQRLRASMMNRLGWL